MKGLVELIADAKVVYEEAFGKKDESWWKGTQHTFDILKLVGYAIQLMELEYYYKSLEQKRLELASRNRVV